MDPQTFKPHALASAPIIREGRIIRDLTMPARDWSQFDAPSMNRPRHKLAKEARP